MQQKLELIQKIKTDESLRNELHVIRKIYDLRRSGKRSVSYADILYKDESEGEMVMSVASLYNSLAFLKKSGLIQDGKAKLSNGVDCTGYRISHGVVKLLKPYFKLDDLK